MELIVNGVPGLDGEYPLVMPPYTTKEWHQIKVKTGLRPLEIEEGWRAGDPDVLNAFGWVSLTRAGHNPIDVWAALDECDPFTALTFKFEEEQPMVEADARPPDSPTVSGVESSPAEPESVTVPPESGGESSSNGGGHLESVPSPTGSQPSDTGVPSALATWAT